MNSSPAPDLILIDGRFRTLDRENPVANAVAIRDGRFLEVGDAQDVMRHRGEQTQVINLRGHTAIPGLNDSHLSRVGAAELAEWRELALSTDFKA